MDSHTNLYAVFGNPVTHSKSPVIHNRGFGRHGLNSVYLAFEIKDIQKGVQAIRTLNIKGASITIPFKTAVMGELDWIDPDAQKIGAVNTIVNDNGILKGYNTDLKGAILPLKSFGIKGKSAFVIGAGGAAQAVAFGLYKEGARITVVNRNREKGVTLAQKLSGDFLHLEKFKALNKLETDFLINTTSIGMFPHVDGQVVPSRLLTSRMIVMDIVYNPLQTRLLKDAQKAGCQTIDGLAMFLVQGAAQFELWTGIWPDTNEWRTAILNGENT